MHSHARTDSIIHVPSIFFTRLKVREQDLSGSMGAESFASWLTASIVQPTFFFTEKKPNAKDFGKKLTMGVTYADRK